MPMLKITVDCQWSNKNLLFYAPLIPTNVLFLECCDSIQVFYGSTNQEYTRFNIYGFYVKQEDLVNGRAWYKNEGISIWWDGTNNWNIGSTTKKGSKKAYAFLKNDGTCLPKISNPKWKFGPSSSPDHSNWYDAGNAVKIRCGSNPGKGLRYFRANVRSEIPKYSLIFSQKKRT